MQAPTSRAFANGWRRSPLALVIMGTLTSALAHAENEQSDIETIQVLGDTYRNTATKTVLAPEETPQAVTVIDRDTIEQRQASSLSEVVRYTPGVNTELRGGAVTRLDLFNIRGFINYQNFFDGLAVPYNTWNLQPQIDPIAIEQVEVFKGPTSVLYGNIPPGGMVNMIAKTPQQQAAHRVAVSTDSDALREVSVDSTGAISDTSLAYRMVALARQKDGQAGDSEEERYVVAPSLDWRVSPDTLVNVNLYYQADPAAGIYTSLPAKGSVLHSDKGRLSSDSFSGDNHWNTYDREFLMLGYKVQHQLSADWSVLHTARYTDADLLQKNMYHQKSSDGQHYPRNAYLTDESMTSWVVDTQLSGDLRWGKAQHYTLFGLDYQNMSSDVSYDDTLAGVVPDIDIFHPNNHQVDPSTLTFVYQDQHDIEVAQTGIYAQDQILWKQWVLLAGARYDEYELKDDQRTLYAGTPSGSDKTIRHYNLALRAGAMYQFNNGISPYLSYSESFEPTDMDNRGNVFDPSTGKQWEAGLKYLSLDGTTGFNLALFELKKQDALVNDPNDSYAKIQTGEIRSRGIEVSLDHALSVDTDVSLTYGYMDMEITDDPNLEGKTPVWVPEQTASAWLNHQVSAGTRISVGVRYVGESQGNATNTFTVPDYTVFDTAIRYDLSQLSSSLSGANVSLSATNLFDKTTYSCFDELNCWYGDERNIKAKLSVDF
ncbi:TonB-dependent siderophore receptor [Salinivibrio proteolyticus]|uniref:TonB-dependent siderophore receptor n=1 Tax=Salinivibrio proteolyticus TaxID=334715 RepID=A0ABY7LGQ9_9GAMM|nr:TonB-dependent siderophore receptor [Salinivibrio proteolyticus]WBA15792.1 TonB-dependent siderophore receptor [Salinivibrio proteolyticus]